MSSSAAATVESESGAEERQFLTFRTAADSYAVGIMMVKEILEYGTVTQVPMMPSWIRGVINLRGRVVPVVDLAMRLGNIAGEVTRKTCIIIVETGQEDERQDMGIVVDAVLQVIDIPEDCVEPAPSFGGRLRTDFIAGVGKVDGKFVVVLDLENVLSMNELAHIGYGTPIPAGEPSLDSPADHA